MFNNVRPRDIDSKVELSERIPTFSGVCSCLGLSQTSDNELAANAA